MAVDDRALKERLRHLQRDQIPFAMKITINNLMRDTIGTERAEMNRVFDRPTPFVLRGLRVAKYAKKNDPSGKIWFKNLGRFRDAVENTLRPQIEGGARRAKSSENRLRRIGVLRYGEWLVPGEAARLNRYGNVSGATYVRVISYFRGFRETEQVRINRRRGARSSKSGYRYFVQRTGTGRAIFEVRGRRGRARPVFYITSRTPQYRRRFPFYAVAQANANKRGPDIASEAMDKALKTRKRRGR